MASIIQDPRYVTNWADPLRKHVADEHRKNREHLAEQLAHSAQVEKADTGVLALNIIKKYKPLHYKDLPKITIEDIERAYDLEYTRLVKALKKIEEIK